MNPTMIVAPGVIAASLAAGGGLLWALVRNRSLSIQERQAWLILWSFGLAGVGFVILDLLLRLPRMAGIDIAGLLTLVAVSSWIGRRERREGKPVADERDQEITRRADLIGYAVFWMAFIVACTAPLLLKGPRSTVTLPTGLLILLVYDGFAIMMVVRSLVVVTLYRRGVQ